MRAVSRHVKAITKIDKEIKELIADKDFLEDTGSIYIMNLIDKRLNQLGVQRDDRITKMVQIQEKRELNPDQREVLVTIEQTVIFLKENNYRNMSLFKCRSEYTDLSNLLKKVMTSEDKNNTPCGEVMMILHNGLRAEFMSQFIRYNTQLINKLYFIFSEHYDLTEDYIEKIRTVEPGHYSVMDSLILITDD